MRPLTLAMVAVLALLAAATPALGADTTKPTAVLSLPSSVQPGSPIHLDAGKSFDIGGTVVSYRWTVAGRPVVVTSSSTFDAPALTAGVYPVSLVVVDDSGNQSSADTKQLLVRDTIAPTAVLAVPTTPVVAGTAIHLAASKSFDVGGTIVQYRWTVAGRPPVVTDTPSFDAPGLAVAGTYPVSLVVTDDGGNDSAADTKQVAVIRDVAAPTAVLELPTSASAGQPIHLVGAKSFDVGGTVVQYRWTIAGRATVVTDTPTFDAPSLPTGAYPVSLVVTDDSGNDSAPDSHQLVVRDTTAPTASLDAPTTIVSGTNIHLSALKSFDVGGSIVQYRWGVWGRTTTTTTAPTFDMPSLGAGTYQLSLAVVDDSGNASATVTRTLLVTPDATKVTTFGKATLFAPVDKTMSQITLHTHTLLAGRIFSTTAGRLDATFSLRRAGAGPVALGHARLALRSGGVQRLQIRLTARGLRALRGKRRVTVVMRVAIADGTSNTIVSRDVTFAVNR